jgi:hypothetical protein
MPMRILLPFKVSVTGGTGGRGGTKYWHIIGQEDTRFFGLRVTTGKSICQRYPSGEGRITMTSSRLISRVVVVTEGAGRPFCPNCVKIAKCAENQYYWTLGAEGLRKETGFAHCLTCKKRDLADRIQRGECIHCDPDAQEIPF